MKRALITGSAGFVGRHFARQLAAEGGWQLTKVDTKTGIDALRFFHYPTQERGYDLVVHAAAVDVHRAAIDATPLTQAANIELDAACFQWALKNDARRVIYFSSSAAYPVRLQHFDRHHRLAENDIDLLDPERPDAMYGWAKLTGERIANAARLAGLKVTVVRPFSGYGSDQDENFPFRAFIERARRGEDPFQIWGTGTQVRDFIHIDDIVAATLEAARLDIVQPVNLGTGRPVSMLTLSNMVCNQARYRPTVKFCSSQPAGVDWRVADPARLRGFYQPQVSLEEGIERALSSPDS